VKKVERSEILDYQTYTEKRDEIRSSAMHEKDRRRIHLGEHLTFLFENTDTIRYQILEMVRIEKMVKEAGIQHEIDTYNNLLGESGELTCTLLIEYEDPSERDKMLGSLTDLPEKIYLLMENGKKVYPEYDRDQMSDVKLSSVQFLKFSCSSPPAAIGSEHSLLKIESPLTAEQKELLKSDLR